MNLTKNAKKFTWKGALSLFLTLAMVISCMCGALTTAAATTATTYPTKMVHSSGEYWSWAALDLGSLTAEHDYVLKFLVSEETGNFVIANTTQGESNSVTVDSNELDGTTKIRTISFNISGETGAYYLRFRQFNGVYLAGFELYDATTDSHLESNLLNYNLTSGLLGFRSNWAAAAENDTTLNDDGAILALEDFDAEVFGIEVQKDDPDEPASTYPTKMVHSSGDYWSWAALDLGSLTAEHDYVLKFLVSEETGNFVIANTTQGESNSVTIDSNELDGTTKIRTISFNISGETGAYYLRFRQFNGVYLAGFELYDATTDSHLESNLLNYNLTSGLLGFRSNWAAAAENDTTLNDDGAILTLEDFDADVFGIVIQEDEPETTYPTKMVHSTGDYWSWAALKLGELTAEHDYVLKFLISEDGGNFVVTNAVQGESNTVTVASNELDSTTKIRTINFNISGDTGVYYLRFRQFNGVYMAGFELYDATSDSHLETNLLNYNLTAGLYGFRSNWAEAEENATSLNNDGAILALEDFDADVFGIVIQEDEPETTYPAKMVHSTGDYWSWAALDLGSLTAEHDYVLKFLISEAEGNFVVTNAVQGESNTVTVASSELDSTTKIRTINFNISGDTGVYYLRFRQFNGVYLAGFELYDATSDSHLETNLLNYDLTAGLYGFRSNWAEAEENATSLNNDGAILALEDFDKTVFGITDTEPGDPTADYPAKMVESTGDYWAWAALDLGELTAEHDYVLKFLISEDGGNFVVTNAVQGESNTVTVTANTLDADKRTREIDFTVSGDTGAYYLRFRQFNGVNFAGFELYDATSDSHLETNLLNYDLTDGLLGFRTNWAAAEKDATSLNNDGAILTLKDFDGLVMGVQKAAVTGNVVIGAKNYAKGVLLTLSTDFISSQLISTVSFDSDKFFFVGARKVSSKITLSVEPDVASVKVTASISGGSQKGAWVYLYFEKIVENCPVGGFSLAADKVYNKAGYETEGFTTLVQMPNDTNGDGLLDVRDLVRIKKYEADSTVEVAADNIMGEAAEGVLAVKTALLEGFVSDIYAGKNKEADLSAVMAEAGGADTAATTKRDAIKTSTDALTVEGDIYYVSENGDVNATGETPEEAVTVDAVASLDLAEGDAVLFERGGKYRLTAPISVVNGVTYGAYGEGAKPELYGSVKNYSYYGAWNPAMANIYAAENIDAVGNIVLNYGQVTGVLRSSTGACSKDGDYWYDSDNKLLYMYCADGCPDEVYEDIEIATVDSAFSGTNASDVTIDNLCMKYFANHTISFTTSHDITVTNCEIGYGGGDKFGDDRLGNGIQFWMSSSNITVENNWIYQQFDAGVTFQSELAATFDNINIKNNLIEYCSYNIEYFINTDTGSKVSNIAISDNILRMAGYGFGMARYNAYGVANFNAWNYTVTDTTNFAITGNVFDCSARALVCWWWTEGNTQPGLSVSGNSFYQKAYDTATAPVTNTESLVQNAAMCFGVATGYGDTATATNTSELVEAVSAFDASAATVAYLAD